MASQNESPPVKYLRKVDFEVLFTVLREWGYTVIGPTVDQAAIVYGELHSSDDLPKGWTDRQAPGEYRIERRDDGAWFGYNVGPHSWKRYLFPSQAALAVADWTDAGWEMRACPDTAPNYAFLGVRACELAAIRIQDRVFIGGEYVDPIYQGRRERALVIAVNCTQAASTCFCTSMDTGPRCTKGFDLALTELADGFLVEVDSDRGAQLAAELPLVPATAEFQSQGADARQQAIDQIERKFDTQDIRDLLVSNLEHRQWDDVAERCISCTNCTMVCPTCFCHSVAEVSDLAATHVERQRSWDSCFNFDFSYMNGGVVRNQIRSRYRQWLTHKLATWFDQFGTSGCVGCGRCIAWCPVGIDLTAEVDSIRGSQP